MHTYIHTNTYDKYMWRVYIHKYKYITDLFVCKGHRNDTFQRGCPAPSVGVCVCVSWLIPMCAMTRSHIYHDVFMCVPWLVYVCAMPHCSVWRGCTGASVGMCVTCVSCVCNVRVMTHSYVCHDTFPRVPWLIYTCAMTHLHVCHDSFTCVPCHTALCDVAALGHL